MASKQRNRFHLSHYPLLCSRHIWEGVDQFHSPSAILLDGWYLHQNLIQACLQGAEDLHLFTMFICEQRQTPWNRQAKDTGAWERDHCNLFLGLGILQHHSVATTKFGFIHTAKKLWAAPNTGQWNCHGLWQWRYQWKCQLEMAPSFLNVSAGEGNWRLHFWLFWARSNRQNEGKKHQVFASATTDPHVAAGYLSQWLKGLSLGRMALSQHFPGLLHMGNPLAPTGTSSEKQVWRASCHLPASLVSRRAKEDK